MTNKDDAGPNFVARHLAARDAHASKPVDLNVGRHSIAQLAAVIALEAVPECNEPPRVRHLMKVETSRGTPLELTRDDLMLVERIWAAATLNDVHGVTRDEWSRSYRPAFLANPARPTWDLRAVFHDERALENKRRAKRQRILFDLLAAGGTFTADGIKVADWREGGLLTMQEARDRLASTPLGGATSGPAPAHEAGGDAGRGETAKQRRDRLLAMFDAEIAAGHERGALARITESEKRTRPTADRSNIGKDIKKARMERDELRRGGALGRLLG